LQTDPSTNCLLRTSSGETGGRCWGSGDTNCYNLIRLSANLFPGTLSRQSLLQSPPLARLQVVGVTLHFLNDVFGLNLALEATQGILQRLTFLQSNFCQADHPQTELIAHTKLTPFALR